MKIQTLEDINKSEYLLYKYIRGSHAYGLNTETSDIDTGGVFSLPLDNLIGTGYNYIDQVQDEKHDNVYYELGKFMSLLCSSNPTVLESLFIPDKCVLYEHPAMTLIKSYKDKFITKRCFHAFGGYAISQIKKARGLNKKCVQPVMTERKDIMDFCYTIYKQGSTNIKNWLAYRNLKQEYCGCVNIPNMPNTYGVYYDWKRHFQDHDMLEKQVELYDWEHEPEIMYNTEMHEQSYYVKKLKELNNGVMPDRDSNNPEIQKLYHGLNMCREFEFDWIARETIFDGDMSYGFYDYYKKIMASDDVDYKGIMNADKTNNEVRLSSVSKGERPICIMTFNSLAYSEHCVQYREYKEWEQNRNPQRYLSNLNKNYDSKNMMHSFRLIKMCIEIAQGKGFNCDRTNIDRQFLLDIKNHKFEYDELISKLDNLKIEMDNAIAKSTLPNDIDPEFINQLCVDVRHLIWNDNKK
jgi:hypothetical protein